MRSGPYERTEITTEDDLRSQFAVRGLGELTELTMGRKSMSLSVENAAMHLWVAGFVQGLYELVFGEGSEVEWKLSEGGLLHVKVAPSAHP